MQWRLARKMARQRIADKIGYVPHAEQAAGHDAIDAGAKQVGMVAGRRGGKSEFWEIETLTELSFGPIGHLPQRLSLIAAPESDITDNIFGLVWKAVVDQKLFGVLPVYKSVQERRLEMPWASKAYGKTTKDPTSLRGPGLVLTVADEYAFGKDIIAQYLMPPLIDCDGILGFATTPNGRNHAYKTFNDWTTQAQIDPRYFTRHWTSYQNPYLPPGSIDRIAEVYRRTGSWDIFRQEYLAEFVALAGAIYPLWDESVHVQEFEPWRDVPGDMGLDWGFKHPFVCLLIQVAGDEQCFVVDEVYLKDLADREKVQAVQAMLAKYNLPQGVAYCDPASPQAIKDFRESGFVVFDPDDMPKVDGQAFRINSVADGIAVTRSIVNRRDPPGLIVHPRCKEFIRTMPEYKFKEKGVNEGPVKVDDDPPDAFRYFAMGRFGMPTFNPEPFFI